MEHLPLCMFCIYVSDMYVSMYKMPYIYKQLDLMIFVVLSNQRHSMIIILFRTSVGILLKTMITVLQFAMPSFPYFYWAIPYMESYIYIRKNVMSIPKTLLLVVSNCKHFKVVWLF